MRTDVCAVTRSRAQRELKARLMKQVGKHFNLNIMKKSFPTPRRLRGHMSPWRQQWRRVVGQVRVDGSAAAVNSGSAEVKRPEAKEHGLKCEVAEYLFTSASSKPHPLVEPANPAN